MVRQIMRLVKRRDPDKKPIASRDWFLWVFSVVLIGTAGTAFTFKLIEFFLTATRSGAESMASFLIPVLNYLLVAAGFACLFFWSMIRGQYKDIEDPALRMLEQNRLADLEDAES